jgi:succinate dehydrogenase / fumarate reductase cytochrome b subunit
MRYSPAETLRQGLAYDGKSGQWVWLLHRLSGMLTVGFIVTHVLDSTLVTFFPNLYRKTIRLFKHPLAGLGEIGLIGAVLFHGLNGLRIVAMDSRPEWWRHQKKANQIVAMAFAALFVPLASKMLISILRHAEGDES